MAVAVAGLVATSCTSGGGSSGHTPPATGPFVHLALSPGGVPHRGGTLNVLGVSDTDFLDPNISYYSVGYAMLREFSRQLYTYSGAEGHQTDVVPDLAAGPPEISADGRTYRVTIRTGAQWNTTPARQVTAADVVRGVKSSCNPSQPFGGLPDFDWLIAGMKQFCARFRKVSPAAKPVADFIEHTSLRGVSLAPKDPLTVVFRLTQPATFFTNILAIPAFSPRPQEFDAYLPGSAGLAQHTLSDGPYEVTSYRPRSSITFGRNPAWKAATDRVRQAYVDRIVIGFTDDPELIQKQLQTGNASADVSEAEVPVGDAPALLRADGGHGDPNLNVQNNGGTNPYIVFNTKTPNGSGALGDVRVRQALSYALNRAHLVQVLGGPKLNPPLTHVLPPSIHGSQPIDPYPYNVARARQMLQSAGASHLKLHLLYMTGNVGYQRAAETVQSDLGAVGVSVTVQAVQPADFFTKYMQRPDSARQGQWDLALTGWFPDWYGDAALSFFGPLFDGRVLPPQSSDFGLYDDPAVDRLIDEAKAAKDVAAADRLWAQADRAVMRDAAIYPITSPNSATYHASQVHNFVYMPAFDAGDYTNMWLDPKTAGG